MLGIHAGQNQIPWPPMMGGASLGRGEASQKVAGGSDAVKIQRERRIAIDRVGDPYVPLEHQPQLFEERFLQVALVLVRELR